MGTEYIVSSVDEFFKKLDDIKDTLENFSGSINKKQEQVFAAIAAFDEESKQYRPHIEDEKNPVDKAMLEAVNETKSVISAWKQKIAESKEGTEFMNEFQKYLVVMVFGAVKAGKSSLGNFFAGKKFLDASFDNAYKQTGHQAVFMQKESRRDVGGIVTDEKGRKWFAEGILDTTGDIQYFTLSGLCWIDSPGTGAVEKETDHLQDGSMDDMVRKYIPYTDLCIFLQNSTAPGLQEDMKYIGLLDKANQSALVVITKSDYNDEDEDEDGNLISCFKAKDPHVRKDQEEHVCNQIKEKYATISTSKYAAMSVSTYLANLGIKEEDEEKYRGGNIDTLMQKISDKVGNDIIALKEEKPKKNVNAFIKSVIGFGDQDKNETASIKYLAKHLNEIKKQIAVNKEKIDAKKLKIGRLITRELENAIDKELAKWARDVQENDRVLSDVEISKKIIQYVNPILEREINKFVQDLIDGYKAQNIDGLRLALNAGGIRKERKTVSHTYTEVYYSSRSPEGVVEHIRSFFGKSYYVRRSRERTVNKTIDLGTNIDEYAERIIPMVRDALQQHVERNLDSIRDRYFLPQEKYADTMLARLAELEKELLTYRFLDVEGC